MQARTLTFARSIQGQVLLASGFALLTALEQKQIPLAALSDVQVNFLRAHRDNGIATRAERLFGPRIQTRLAERFAGVAAVRGGARASHG